MNIPYSFYGKICIMIISIAPTLQHAATKTASVSSGEPVTQDHPIATLMNIPIPPQLITQHDQELALLDSLKNTPRNVATALMISTPLVYKFVTAIKQQRRPTRITGLEPVAILTVLAPLLKSSIGLALIIYALYKINKIISAPYELEKRKALEKQAEHIAELVKKEIAKSLKAEHAHWQETFEDMQKKFAAIEHDLEKKEKEEAERIAILKQLQAKKLEELRVDLTKFIEQERRDGKELRVEIKDMQRRLESMQEAETKELHARVAAFSATTTAELTGIKDSVTGLKETTESMQEQVEGVKEKLTHFSLKLAHVKTSNAKVLELLKKIVGQARLEVPDARERVAPKKAASTKS
jgi:predicted  nucleic acid-binding Zn-ribbon protein